MLADLLFHHLVLLKVKVKDGKVHRIKIIDTICTEWKKLVALLDYASLARELIQYSNSSAHDCCYRILSEWLVKGSTQYRPTWDGLLKLLYDLDFTEFRNCIMKGTIVT